MRSQKSYENEPHGSLEYVESETEHLRLIQNDGEMKSPSLPASLTQKGKTRQAQNAGRIKKIPNAAVAPATCTELSSNLPNHHPQSFDVDDFDPFVLFNHLPRRDHVHVGLIDNRRSRRPQRS